MLREISLTSSLYLILTSTSFGGDGLPTQLGSYKDPRSSKRHIACSGRPVEKRFAESDTVFYGKFLHRKADVKRKVFVDRYKVIKAWKGDVTEGSEVEVDVPPPSDFCTSVRSNRYEGVPGKGGHLLYLKGKPLFSDCCSSESNDVALDDPSALDRLDVQFSKLRNSVK